MYFGGVSGYTYSFYPSISENSALSTLFGSSFISLNQGLICAFRLLHSQTKLLDPFMEKNVLCLEKVCTCFCFGMKQITHRAAVTLTLQQSSNKSSSLSVDAVCGLFTRWGYSFSEITLFFPIIVSVASVKVQYC